MQKKQRKKIKAVLLLQMGGPCCVAGIQDFLFNLFNDKYIIQLPLLLQDYQSNLAKFISSKRAPKVAKLYDEIGGSSPILFETTAQAKALEKKLNKEFENDEFKFKTYIAMRYSYPFLKDTLKDLELDQPQELYVLPLYPQYSLATTGSSFIECKEVFSESGFSNKCKISYVEQWCDNPYFVKLIAQRVFDKLDLIDKKTYLLFSAHGLPEKYVEDGDPYQEQVEKSVAEIIREINLNQKYSDKIFQHSISYQSRVGPVKWLEPNTEDVLIELAKNGIETIVVVPISFVGDHIETLHEIGIEYRELAEENGLHDFHVTRPPKANPLLVQALLSLLPVEFLKSSNNTTLKSQNESSLIQS